MKVLGRDVPLGRVLVVLKRLCLACYRATRKFENPWTVLRCYFRVQLPDAPLRLRDGGSIGLSTYRGDVITVFVVFCKEDYGTDFLGKTILDIGANIGAFAVLAGRAGCRSLVAVEPSLEAYEVLCQNLQNNGLEGVCQPILGAVCAVEAEQVDFPVASSPMNSLENLPLEQPVAKVPALTLKGILEEYFPDGLDLLKMDCEGAEHRIVAEAGDEELRAIREIRAELHGVNIEGTLRRFWALGFRTVLFDRAGPETTTVWLRLDPRMNPDRDRRGAELGGWEGAAQPAFSGPR